MGQGLSCSRSNEEHDFFAAVQAGESEAVRSALTADSSLLRRPTIYDRLSALHIAAANGRLEVLSMLLDRSVPPDDLSRHKQPQWTELLTQNMCGGLRHALNSATLLHIPKGPRMDFEYKISVFLLDTRALALNHKTPLMLAAMHGKTACVQKLLNAGANVLLFDSLHRRTCLHYAAYYGHADCMEAILTAAKTTSIVDSWGFSRFVNIRDGYGATPLHLAARQRRRSCVRILLDNGSLVSASTGGYGFPGSTPLHLAARGGCLDCVRELLAWGADRLQRDASGRIPYVVAFKQNHRVCATLLDPASAEPLVWPSALKFISELNPEAKALLEAALRDANMEREKKLLNQAAYSLPSPSYSDDEREDDASEASGAELCCICFEQACTVEVQECGHQMCAYCTLALCCHSKPNPVTLLIPPPVCPFCRSNITRLVVADSKSTNSEDLVVSPKPRKSRKSCNLSEGSSSFKGLASAMGSFGRMGTRGSGRISDSTDTMDKS